MGRILGLNLWKQGAFWEKKTCCRLNAKWKTFNMQYYVPQCHSCLTTLYFPAYCTSADLRNPKSLASHLVDWSSCLQCSSLRAILWYGPLLKVRWQLSLLWEAPSSSTSCCSEMQKHLKYLNSFSTKSFRNKLAIYLLLWSIGEVAAFCL